MKIKKFFAAILILCFVLSLSSASMAAKKKSAKKKVASQDKIESILKEYKPANATNAQTIRNALAKYKHENILLISIKGGSIGMVVVSKHGETGGEPYATVENTDVKFDTAKKYSVVRIDAFRQGIFEMTFMNTDGKTSEKEDFYDSNYEYCDMMDVAFGSYEATLPFILVR